MEWIFANQGIIEFISQPWHWSVSGAAIALIVFLMTWMGRSFGVSSTFATACSAVGMGKRVSFFDYDWKVDDWRIAFVIGGVLGGFIAGNFLQSPEPVDISMATVNHLEEMGIAYPEADKTGRGFLPTDIFNFGLKGMLLAIGGGFLIGFGARYGGGCTSGHAITGLSHLRVESLLTVIGFFIGGLIMTHFILPILIGL